MKKIELSDDQATTLEGLVNQELDDHEKSMWESCQGDGESGPLSPPQHSLDYRDHLIGLRDLLSAK